LMKEPTMPSEIDLLRQLDPEPPQPSTIDISRAISAGRRRRVHRGLGYAGVAAVTTLAVAGAAVAVGQHHKPTNAVAASPSAPPMSSGLPTSCCTKVAGVISRSCPPSSFACADEW